MPQTVQKIRVGIIFLLLDNDTITTFADSFFRCRLIECNSDSGDREEKRKERPPPPPAAADMVEPPTEAAVTAARADCMPVRL